MEYQLSSGHLSRYVNLVKSLSFDIVVIVIITDVTVPLVVVLYYIVLCQVIAIQILTVKEA